MTTLTQNENPLEPKLFVITFAEFQFVIKTATYIDAKHI